MNNTEVDVRVQFMCEQNGVPICMNMGFTLPRSPYVVNGIAVNEDVLLGKIHDVQKQYNWSKVWFALDDMGKIAWNKICTVEVIDNE